MNSDQDGPSQEIGCALVVMLILAVLISILGWDNVFGQSGASFFLTATVPIDQVDSRVCW